MRGKIQHVGAIVDGWTRQHWQAGGGSVVGWLIAVLVLVLIVVWGATAIGLPRNPADELAPFATQVALPQIKEPNDALDPKDRLALQRDLIEYATDSRVRTWTLLAQVIGAVILGIGGYFTWRNLHVTQERLDVDRQAQITNRFTQAIGQLGAELKDGQPNLEVRLGGIYALERIARDSPRDHWSIMEVLTSYVHQNAPWPTSSDARPSISPWRAGKVADGTVGRPRTDIQAILTVLGRRIRPPDWPEPRRLDLAGANLHRANLSWANLSMANLSWVNLSWANLYTADLSMANLHMTDLSWTDLGGANLKGANLYMADLGGANLYSADLTWASLKGANLSGADLSQANLSGAFGLTADQVKKAGSRVDASFPPRIAEELDGPATESASPPPAAPTGHTSCCE